MLSKRYNYDMSLTPNTVTICTTARLVRGVTLQHQQQALERGASLWQAPEIYTLTQWLDGLIGNTALLGLLPVDALPNMTLSPIAEAYLWEQAIESCLAKHEASALFDIRAMVKTAIEANNLMLNWQITEADINQPFITQETRQFLRWRHTFEALCAKQNAMEASRLMTLHIALITEHQHEITHALTLPTKINLAGFDRITPLEARLFEVLKTCGVQVEMLSSSIVAQPKIECYAIADAQQECRAAVAWAKQKLTDNPQAQLAIISPVLANIRRLLADLLDDAFHPETLHSSFFEASRCYDFSLGLSLTEYPLVHSALQLLRLATTKALLRFDEMTPILQDIHWGLAAEIDARAQLDAFLRKNLNATYSLDALIKQTSRLQSHGIQLDGFFAQIGQIAAFQHKSKNRQLPSAWVTAFVDLLVGIQWAKSRATSSHEYQTQQAFYKALNELSALDALLGNVTASEALQKVIALCSSTMFQPESTGDVHIQILGLLETPAVTLDAVWALNMNDQHWPPAVKLNPLLPAELQRCRGTPNASASVQSQFAALVQQRLVTCATEVVFSYALKEDDRELRPSPLLANQVLSTKQAETMQTLAENLAKPATMQMLDDFMAPPISSEEKIRGGVKLFATQAICPAWAFYQYRLGAGKLDTPIDGLDNMSRGSLLHKVLQFFWEDCRNLSALQAMTIEQRASAIQLAIVKSIEALGHESDFHIPAQVMQIEQQRLQQLLAVWLDLELMRADFSVVACEKKYALDVEGLTLNLTIDRIDRLTDGGLVVIDYKTGSSVASKSWADDRIAEPQLPIYAVLALAGENVAAVSFAKIRSDETKFIGLSAESAVLPAVAALSKVMANSAFNRFNDWEALLEHWYLSLSNIAQEIKAGEARVTVSKETDLVYCDVKPLLRLPERLLQFERKQAALKDEGLNP
ncbi:MAG: PD-(D/E)XK nuclease family protein [Sulfuritalea sp.]|nr:PD-(D/E)XK nuclease family protein [Sulfuritalea sp.]